MHTRTAPRSQRQELASPCLPLLHCFAGSPLPPCLRRGALPCTFSWTARPWRPLCRPPSASPVLLRCLRHLAVRLFAGAHAKSTSAATRRPRPSRTPCVRPDLLLPVRPSRREPELRWIPLALAVQHLASPCCCVHGLRQPPPRADELLPELLSPTNSAAGAARTCLRPPGSQRRRACCPNPPSSVATGLCCSPLSVPASCRCSRTASPSCYPPAACWG